MYIIVIGKKFCKGIQMATYTTATLVRRQVENIDSSLVDDDIDEFIEEAEGIIDAILGRSFVSTFDATKHKILRAAANKWAALCGLGFNPAGFTSSQESDEIADILWDQLQFILSVLERDSSVRYLESL